MKGNIKRLFNEDPEQPTYKRVYEVQFLDPFSKEAIDQEKAERRERARARRLGLKDDITHD